MKTCITTPWQWTGDRGSRAKMTYSCAFCWHPLSAAWPCRPARPAEAGPVMALPPMASNTGAIPDNWSPNGAPQNAEELWFSNFPDALSPDLVMINDLTNLTVQSLDFDLNDINDVSVQLYGNALGISEGVFNTNQFECQVYIHCGVKLEGNATFVTGNPLFTQPFLFAEDMAVHFTGPIDLNGHNLLLWAELRRHPTGGGAHLCRGRNFRRRQRGGARRWNACLSRWKSVLR